MRLYLLRWLLLVNAALLLLLGGAFILLPGRMLLVFGFHGVPPGVQYIVGMFGCVYISLGIGYAFAADNPVRNVAWVQVAILRAALETLFGLACMARGLVAFQHAGFGTVVPALLLLGYIALYPRPEAEYRAPAPAGPS